MKEMQTRLNIRTVRNSHIPEEEYDVASKAAREAIGIHKFPRMVGLHLCTLINIYIYIFTNMLISIIRDRLTYS